MQENSDQKATSQDEAGDLRTSRGEVVRRVDLDRAAGTPGRFVRENPDVAGYEGVRLAKAALAGDQAALDEFHDLAGLVLPGVTEYSEGSVVRLVLIKVDEKVADLEVQGTVRATFQATNQGGYDSTRVDAPELVAWVLSSEGRAALARRGVNIPATSVATTYNPAEVERLIAETREDNERLTAAVPNCTCTGWYDTPGDSHEWSCARTRHAVALDSATRRLRDGNLRAMIDQLQAMRDAHAAARVLIAKRDANFERVVEALGLAPGGLQLLRPVRV